MRNESAPKARAGNATAAKANLNPPAPARGPKMYGKSAHPNASGERDIKVAHQRIEQRPERYHHHGTDELAWVEGHALPEGGAWRSGLYRHVFPTGSSHPNVLV